MAERHEPGGTSQEARGKRLDCAKLDEHFHKVPTATHQAGAVIPSTHFSGSAGTLRYSFLGEIKTYPISIQFTQYCYLPTYPYMFQPQKAITTAPGKVSACADAKSRAARSITESGSDSEDHITDHHPTLITTSVARYDMIPETQLLWHTGSEQLQNQEPCAMRRSYQKK